ncbi:unnamed protein product [Arabidopsis thaliana]|uniref:(thale cress) hypothetical protein n=1 Tax=Arabidopsis thaliana TaxID=3702 RepID=A0A7G2E7J7_ARATH|nr:unnamed protein product [Arabidopsis thaliana]
MASKALVLFGLFAVLLVVTEVAAASGTVKSESGETVQPDQYNGEVTMAVQGVVRMLEKLFRLSLVN